MGRKNPPQKPSSFQCEKCSFVSKTKLGLERHIGYFCTQCSLCLAEQMEVAIHSTLHGLCKLKKCEFISRGTRNLKEHVVDKHPKDHFPYTKCKSVLKTEKRFDVPF